jgi:hypothetical protein
MPDTWQEILSCEKWQEYHHETLPLMWSLTGALLSQKRESKLNKPNDKVNPILVS